MPRPRRHSPTEDTLLPASLLAIVVVIVVCCVLSVVKAPPAGDAAAGGSAAPASQSEYKLIDGVQVCKHRTGHPTYGAKELVELANELRGKNIPIYHLLDEEKNVTLFFSTTRERGALICLGELHSLRNQGAKGDRVADFIADSHVEIVGDKLLVTHKIDTGPTDTGGAPAHRSLLSPLSLKIPVLGPLAGVWFFRASDAVMLGKKFDVEEASTTEPRYFYFALPIEEFARVEARAAYYDQGAEFAFNPFTLAEYSVKVMGGDRAPEVRLKLDHGEILVYANPGDQEPVYTKPRLRADGKPHPEELSCPVHFHLGAAFFRPDEQQWESIIQGDFVYDAVEDRPIAKVHRSPFAFKDSHTWYAVIQPLSAFNDLEGPVLSAGRVLITHRRSDKNLELELKSDKAVVTKKSFEITRIDSAHQYIAVNAVGSLAAQAIVYRRLYTVPVEDLMP